jgi:dihydropteroate synthase
MNLKNFMPESNDPSLELNGFIWKLSNPSIMGILNATPDSFSDGGLYYHPERARSQISKMHRDGAQIIDIGAESTRPGSKPISEAMEISRLHPLLKSLPKDKYLISIDSNKIQVQESCIKLGAHIINDVFGGSIPLFQLAEEYQVGLVLMHSSGIPETMQNNTEYTNIMDDILFWMEEKRKALSAFSTPVVWYDPGIGFGKTLEQNLILMSHLDRFKKEGFPVLLGSSRKSWIDKLFGVDVHHRLGASISSILYAYQQGCELFRVHDVFESNQALQTLKVLEKNRNG